LNLVGFFKGMYLGFFEDSWFWRRWVECYWTFPVRTPMSIGMQRHPVANAANWVEEKAVRRGGNRNAITGTGENCCLPST
jgi:hypothetical protein